MTSSSRLQRWTESCPTLVHHFILPPLKRFPLISPYNVPRTFPPPSLSSLQHTLSFKFTAEPFKKVAIGANVAVPSMYLLTSVTRLGDLWDFGQLFKAFGNNSIAQISHILRQFFKVSKPIIFLVKSFLGKFYRHLAIFFWSHCN